MSFTKIITIFGATGAQGGSVIQSLIKNTNDEFKLRGITRNKESEKSKALVAQGVEMIQADGLVKDQVAEALKGSWGVFVNTNSDDSALGQQEGPSETELGKNVVDAAAEGGVQHFVYSGMESAAKITKGAVPNKSFDEKNAIGEYAKTKGFKSCVIVSPGWYMENHLVEELAPIMGGFPFKADEEGYYTLRVPRWGGNEEINFISIGDDYGDLVHGVFLDPERYNGQLVQGMSQSALITEMIAAFDKATGNKGRFVPIEDWRDFETYGDRALETVKYMFAFCQAGGGLYYGVPNDMTVPRELKAAAAKAQGNTEGNLMTLERFFSKHFSA